MRAINHALTGAVIGLSVSNPVVALPLAFASHLALDAVPHYDPEGNEESLFRTTLFNYLLILDAILCALLVLFLFIAVPDDWLLAAVCAFLAASPDLFWIPGYLRVVRTGKFKRTRNAFMRFHGWVQWATGPKYWFVEAIWFFGMLALLWQFI